MNKLLFLAAIGVASVSHVALAAEAKNANFSNECGIALDAPIFGVGMAVDTDPTPVLKPIEQGIVARGDKSAQLRSIPVNAVDVQNWTADYAFMRLSQVAGKPIWAVTEDGMPGASVSAHIPATNLADAFDRIAAVEGKRWRYDGDKVYLLGGRDWSVPLPASRDLALAVRDALAKNAINAKIEPTKISFQADDAGAAKVSNVLMQVYAQERLNPYDVSFYKVYPTKGAIDWSTLAERTDSVESVSFDGKGATIVLEPTAEAVVETFLAREGDVRSMGATTMVSGQANLGTSHIAGCGDQADAGKGLELAGGAYQRGRVALSYSVLGGQEQQSGQLAVAPGSIVVIADGEPKEGAYMVAIVRPRVIELQGGMAPAVSPVGPSSQPLRVAQIPPSASSQ